MQFEEHTLSAVPSSEEVFDVCRAALAVLFFGGGFESYVFAVCGRVDSPAGTQACSMYKMDVLSN